MPQEHSHDDILESLEAGESAADRVIQLLEDLEKDMHNAETMPRTLGPPRDNDTGTHYPGLG